MSLSERIKTRRKELELSQFEVARRAGITQGAVAHLEKAISESSRHLPKIAVALSTSVEWLTTGKNAPSGNIIAIPAGQQVPLISSVRAGNWGEINDHEPDTDITFTARETTPSKYAFALRVDGDSMTCDSGLSFPEGTVLIVEPERNPKAGDFVVAKDVVTQKATFKRLTTDGARWYLRALNRDYPPIEIDAPEQRVIGVVIEYWTGGKL